MAELTEEQIDAVVNAAKLISRSLDESMRADEEINLAASTGTNDLKFEQVKPGRLLVLEALSAEDVTSSPTRICVGYWNGHSNNWLVSQPAPLAKETVFVGGPIRLREGMYPIVSIEGATSGDDLYAVLNGYWVKTK